MNLYLLENQNWKLFENLTPDSEELKSRNITISADSKFYGNCYIGNNSTVYNSTVYNSRVYNSTVYNSTVYNSSRVYNSTVYNSRVNNSIVSNNSRVYNSTVYNSTVYNSSRVYNSTVDNNSRVNNSIVYNSRVYNNSTVYNSRVNNSIVSNNSIVENSIVEEAQLDNYTSISIIGTRGLVSRLNTYPDGSIQIGCIKKTAEEWLETYEEVGKEYNFSEKEIQEYGMHIRYLIDLEKFRNEK